MSDTNTRGQQLINSLLAEKTKGLLKGIFTLKQSDHEELFPIITATFPNAKLVSHVNGLNLYEIDPL